ncbi:RNA-directed DNA polymerase, eukaryota, reverse transcriptase zinc-binding domain protein [Tanacetum coccineum]
MATPKMTLKLLVDKKGGKVLFAEATKEFVDFLFHIFLLLPLGTLIGFLGSKQMVGCLGNTFLLSYGACSDGESGTSNKIYRGLMNVKMNSILPKEAKKKKRKLTGGYVKEVVTYMVMDDLVVKPMSTISSITLITKFGVKDLNHLEEKTVYFCKDEGLKLLKSALKSNTVLTKVFLSKAGKGMNFVGYIHKKMGNRLHTYFWDDIWKGDTALKILYPRIYALETNKNIFVASKLGQNNLGLSLRRILRGGVEQSQLEALREFSYNTMLVDSMDRWLWSLEGSEIFSVASVRRKIDKNLLLMVSSKTRWVNEVPKKVNIHAWKVKLDCLPTRLNISRRGELPELFLMGWIMTDAKRLPTPVSAPTGPGELFLMRWTMVGAKKHPEVGCSRQLTSFVDIQNVS